MRNTQYLFMPADLGQLLRHFLSRPARYTGIYLIKNQGSNGLLFRQNIFQRQHNAGQLSTGGNLGNWPWSFSDIGGHQESNHITAVCSRFFFRKGNTKPDFSHVQFPQFSLNSGFQNLCRILSRLSENCAGSQGGCFRCLQLFLQMCQRIICRLNGVQFHPASFQIGETVLHRGAVFLFQAVQLIKAAFHSIQLRWRKVKFRLLIPNYFRKVEHFTAQRSQSLI